MAGISTYLANKLLDHVNGRAVYTPPTALKLCLYVTNPTAADTGTEVTGGSYARIDVSTLFPAAASNQAPSSSTVTFTGLPVVTFAYAAVRDAVADGNHLLYFGALASSFTATSGSNFTLPIGTVIPEIF